MRAYRNLLAHLAESDPQRLGRLPRDFLRTQAEWLLRHGEVYVLEQVDKHVPVVGALPAHHLARAAGEALDAGRVDDFCFLHARLAPRDRPAPGRVAAAYARLATRGNAAGIEQIANATGVAPALDKDAALRAYDVLVAAGRLGAVDYVRQISGVPVRFAPRAVATGARTLLLSGRYGALRALARHARDQSLSLGVEDVRAAAEHAFDDGRLTALAGALGRLDGAPPLPGFAAYFRRLVAAERYTELPALFVLCAEPDWELMTARVWEALLVAGRADGAAPALRFAFEHHQDTDRLARHAAGAYRVGVAAGDRALVRLACERGGAPLADTDVAALLGDALAGGDLPWIEFAADRLDGGRLPEVEPDAAQLFLALIAADHHPARRVTAAAGALGVAPDGDVGRWLLELSAGRPEAAARVAPAAGHHPVAAAVHGTRAADAADAADAAGGGGGS